MRVDPDAVAAVDEWGILVKIVRSRLMGRLTTSGKITHCPLRWSARFPPSRKVGPRPYRVVTRVWWPKPTACGRGQWAPPIVSLHRP
jgi:hypothetical protein